MLILPAHPSWTYLLLWYSLQPSQRKTENTAGWPQHPTFQRSHNCKGCILVVIKMMLPSCILCLRGQHWKRRLKCKHHFWDRNFTITQNKRTRKKDNLRNLLPFLPRNKQPWGLAWASGQLNSLAVQRKPGPIHQQGWEAPSLFSSHHPTSWRGIQGTSGLIVLRGVLSHVLPGFPHCPISEVAWGGGVNA